MISRGVFQPKELCEGFKFLKAAEWHFHQMSRESVSSEGVTTVVLSKCHSDCYTIALKKTRDFLLF